MKLSLGDRLGKLLVHAVTRPLRARLYITPNLLGLTYEEVCFPSAHPDGAALSGWLIPARKARGAVLLCHGIGSTRLWMLDKAALLHDLGFTTLLFDFRSRGLSKGERCTLGVRERDDVLAALALLKAHPSCSGLPLGAVGESLGAAALLEAAQFEPELTALCLEACFTTLEDAIARRCAWLPRTWRRPVQDWLSRNLTRWAEVDPSVIRPVERIAELPGRAFLIIHDAWDIWCPRTNADDLFCAASDPKELWLAERTPHVWAAWASRSAYRSRVGGFFTRQLALEAAPFLE